MSWVEIIADRKIRDAQEEGQFDNLPGKGKPLNLDQDPRVPPELRMAHRLMKEANILPDWIQVNKELRDAQARWDARLEAFAARWDADPLHARGGDDRLDRRRDIFLEEAAEGLRALNTQIDRLNLIVPSLAQQRPRIDLRARMEELEARFPRSRPYPGEGRAPWERVLEEARPEVRLGNRMPLRRRRGKAL